MDCKNRIFLVLLTLIVFTVSFGGTVRAQANFLPVLDPIGAQSTTENVLLSFAVTASDSESVPVLTTSALPPGANFNDNLNGTGDFSWTPTFLQSGIYNVTFYATDDSAAVDSEIVTITVNDAGNQNPTLNTIGAQSIDEGLQLTFGVTSSDPEDPSPALTTSTPPTGANFTDNGDGTGDFDWTPDFTQSGIYNITFYATDDSTAVDSEVVSITVNNVNQAPVLTAIGNQSVDENVNLNVVINASDPDGTTPSFTTSALPTGANFNDNLDGTGTFDWTPDFTQSGTYFVTFRATDGALTDSEVVQITVNNVNQAPVLTAIGAQSVTENVNLNFGVSANDPDGTTPSLTTSTLPNGASFIDNGNGTGTFDWTPLFNQSGVHNITFIASDGSLVDSEVVAITVNDAGNQPVTLNAIGNKSVNEGVNLNFNILATDPDSTFPTLSTSSLPSGANFNDNSDGTGTFDWTPGFDQAGSYNVTFYATDGITTDSEVININVFEVGNQAPILASIGNKSVDEGVLLSFGVSASDPDGTTPSLSTSTLPSGANFVNNGDGTGSFTWTPGFNQAGSYNVTFYASDGVASDSEQISITVQEAGNQSPVLATIGAKGTTEGVNLNFVVTSSDPDGTIPGLSTSTLPTGASFNDNADGTGTFDWTPNFIQSGSYNVTFYATDGVATDSEQITITVAEAGNQSPVLAAIGSKNTSEGVNLAFAVTASDPDSTTPSILTSALPSGVSFLDNGDGTADFSWTPSFVQSGTYFITFYADDGIATDSEVVTITVNEVGNQEPVLATIGPRNTTEGINLNFNVTATDADGPFPLLSTSTLPGGATFNDNGDGTGTFDWTPGFTQAGSYFVFFYAADDSAAVDSEVVSITVNEAGNQAPILATIGAQSTTENVLLTFGISATDPDGTTPTLSTSTLPLGAIFNNNGDGTGSFSWTPTFVQAGIYNVTFYTSDAALTDSEVVTITVNDAGNQAPVLAPIGTQSTTEGVLLSFSVSATDPDETIPSLTTSTLPTGASFLDNGDGTGDFNWTPDFVQSNVYNITFYANDGSTDSEVVSITVNDAGNQDPVLATIGARNVFENSNLNFVVSATDPEGDIPALTTSTLPSGASFNDNGDGTGTFDWSPGFTQSGSYPVTFYATDDTLAADSELVTITVLEIGNQPPVLAAIGSQSTSENVLLSFALSSTDPDGTFPNLLADSLPAGASIIDNGDGTGTFNWTPSFVQSGSYNVIIIASDGLAADSETISITVSEAGNQDPVLALIGSRNIVEGNNLNFIVSAVDPESAPPVLTTSTLPSGASFNDNGDGTGTFDWTPGFTQSGTYGVTFYATDDSSAVDSENVAITVTEAGNQPPVLATIGPKSTTENTLLTFNTSGSDPDGTIPTMSANGLPTGANFNDNGDGTGTFTWTPDFTQNGTYNVTFRASDGALVDSEIVSITVNEVGNQAPVLAAIGSQSVTEGVSLNFNISASDVDGTTPSFSTSSLPIGASFIDNLDGTGTFDWTPGFTQDGGYNVTFYATDGALTDSEVVTITVNEAGNQSPVLAAIGSKSTTEGIELTFNASAADPDSTTPTFSSGPLPSGANFVDNLDGTGTFTWTPLFTQGGVYNVIIIASDGSLSDSETVTVTVTEAGNQPPVLAAIGPKNVTEGSNLNFVVSAIDPDGTIPSMTTSALPSGASYNDNGDGTGTFDWTPGFTQAGSYSVTFFTSDGPTTDSEIVSITVNEAGNQSPVLAAIGPQSTTEGVLLNFVASATDPDGTVPTLSTSTLPSGASFIDNGDGTGSFSWTPTFVQSGSYPVTFYASDVAETDSEVVSITINEAGNQAPVLATIGGRATTEGINLNFNISASDVDGTTPTLSATFLPGGASFNDNGDGTGTFDWTPNFTQSGTYNVRFFASDGLISDSEIVTISVSEAGNQPPVLDPIGSKVITEGINLTFGVSSSDPDGINPTLTTSVLPSGASFLDNGDGTGTFDWTPTFTQAGLYNITFFASDGAIKDSEIVSISIIEAGNQDPILATIGARSTTEGINLNFNISASDPDNTIPNLTTSTLPAGASFINNGNGTGTFDWTPTFTQSGTFNVTFYATDGLGTDSERVTITVFEAGNQLPVLAVIGAKNVTEGNLLTFNVSSSDPDGTFPALSTSSLPGGASFLDNFDGTGSFSWTPSFVQSGVYPITFYATDGSATDSEVVTITVNDAGNQAPVLAAIGSKSTTEGINLNFGISASDDDGTTPALTSSTLPSGASFNDNGDGTGTFDWTPGFAQAGTYNVKFYASDGIAIDSEAVTINVNEAGNQFPVLNAIGAQAGTEGVNLNFGVSASDPDGSTPLLLATQLPSGATFTDNFDGTGTFDWTPGFTQSGTHNVKFVATDGVLRDSEFVSITIVESGNQAPVLAAIGAQSVTEGVNLSFGISSSDPDGTTPTLSTSALPGSAIFNDNGDGTGTFDWTPNFTEAGLYNVTFRASDGIVIDSEVVTITVNEAGNQSPVLAAIGGKNVTEGNNLNFIATATDPDGTTPSLTTGTLPSGANFNDNGDGTGTFDWTPNFTQGGSYNVLFIATDGALADSETISISVNEAGNQPPVLASIGFRSVTEGNNLNFNISATDADGTTPTLSTSTLPSGATFNDNGDGTGTFDWTPDFTQSGTYNIRFRASDGVVVDSEIVQITVNEVGNQAPILAAIGAKNVTEGALLNFNISSSDADGSTPSLSTSSLPSGASFIDNFDGTGTFDWTPTFVQSGVYPVTFYATDGSATDSEIVSITVNEAGNRLPVLAAIGNKNVTEGINLIFNISSSDEDGPAPVLTTSTLPGGATFVDSSNGVGSFSWTPSFVQSGAYNVTFYATDDSLDVDSEQITITVLDAGNQTPVLAVIGSKNVSEGANLNFNISATDPDGTTPGLSTSTLPSGASFINNGDGTGTFDWSPTFTQAGSYFVIFYATDGLASDSEIVSITVNEAGNQAPVLASVGSKSVNEGVNLNFVVSATDPDGTTPNMTAVNLPGGASYLNNGDGTGTFDWTPTFIQAGVYNVTFRASDGALVDSEIVQITVNESGNQAPILSTIGSKNTTEGINLAFGVSATDPDGTTPSLSTSTLPSGASFNDNGDGTGNFSWTPNFTQSGGYFVIFYASDGSAVDSEVVSVTVNEAGNQAPVLATIGSRSITEGLNLNFGISASDPDGTSPTLTTSTLPSGANFTDNGDGTGTFDWTPTFTQSGGYSIKFYASDGLVTDSEQITITVIEAGNQAPVLAPVGAQSTPEGVLLSFGVTATDPDGSTPSITTLTLPSGANFVDNGNGTASFSWTPTFVQAGSYNVTFRATDGLAIDSEVVVITVTESGNQAPVLAVIGSKSTTEGNLLSFNVSATDADGTFPTLTTTTLPSGALFNDNGDGTGSFDWTPNFTQAGLYNVTFYAGDGIATDSEVVAITVGEAGNQAPVLAAIGSKNTTENVNLNFNISATDPDGTIPTLTVVNLPSGASFNDNLDGTATFNWTPSFVQAGVYSVRFRASDGVLVDSEIVSITVFETGNQAPVLASIGAQSVNEGVNLNFVVSASDVDGTTPSLTTSALPSGASFVNNGNGTGTFDWTPDFTQSGIYNVTFRATDGSLTDSEVVVITVNESGNQAPVLAFIGPKGVTEGVNLNFNISATDPDGTTPSLTTSALPSGASFNDNLDGTGSFSWTPDFTQSGIYNVTFYASDGLIVDSEVVTITVNDVGNQRPVLAAIGSRSTTENINLNFNISATDPDGTTPSLSASSLPSGASFNDNGDGTGTFDWTPSFIQDGIYIVIFRASDGVLVDSEFVQITVNEAGNQPPVLAAIGAQAINEGANLNFVISATDADATIPNLSASTLPGGASFIDNGDGTGTFDWTPSFTQAGSYNVTFSASDGIAIDSEVVTITVNESGNQTPVLALIGPKATTEGVNLNFNVSATDADSTIPILSTSTLPSGASFNDNGDGTGTFDWSPTFVQAGSYNITFRASDGIATDSEIVVVTVNEAGNQQPVLSTISPKSTTEGVNLTFNVSASDPDGVIPTLSTSTRPPNANFTDNGDGTGTFDWTPGFTQAGSYFIIFYASDGVAIDSEIVSITVNEAGNQAPVLANIGPQNVNEGVLLLINVSATDPDGTTPIISSGTLPSGANFVNNGNGTGTFSWTPTFTQSGAYNVTFRASDGSLTDSEIVVITVNEVGNQPPILASIGAKAVNEGINLNFNISATDADGTIPSFTTSTLPTGANFVDNADGTATFDWTPAFTQSGVYNITFRASDGLLVDSEVVQISVIDVGNQRPILAAIGSKSVTEGNLLSFVMTATDPDGTVPTINSGTLPSGATFLDNGNGTADFNWTPTFTQSGVYNVLFYASDGVLRDSEIVQITVFEAGNQPPVLAAIGPQVTNEGVNLNFVISATDPDLTIPSFTTSSLPGGASFVNNGNGTATFDWTPTFVQAGIYNVTFRASDGSLVDSEVVQITVNDGGNQTPVLASIGPRNVNEGNNLTFNVSATDADGTTPALSTGTLPGGASFIDNADGTGTFSWTPNFTQSGTYNVVFRASDGLATDSEIVVISVNESGNQAPILATIGPKSTTEDVNLNFNVSATDPDGTIPALTTSTLPAGATFNDNGDGTGTFDWTPDFTQSGTYNIVFRALDGVARDTEIVSITVNEVGNQAPILAAIGPQNTTEGINLNFGISATDADGSTPVLSTSALPAGASFVDNLNGTGTFNWTPNFVQAGSYNITFRASDGSLVDSEIVVVTVNEAGNQPPILAPIGAKSTTEGVLLNFNISATDPDSTTPSFTTSSIPSGASFNDNGDGTATFSWTPTFVQAGTYNITFRAQDGLAVDSEVVVVTVNEAGNQPPVLAAIGPKSITEGQLLTFGISATDVDGPAPTLTTSTLPSGASFVNNGNGTGTFNWTPSFVQSGNYFVIFYASDGIASDSEIVSITVNEAGNQAPILATIGPQSVNEGINLNFNVSATDPDLTIPTLSTGTLPSGASFVNNGNGTGSFNWTPTFTQSGSYNVVFRATDGALVDSEIVTITVTEGGNQAPVLALIGAKSVTEGNLLSFNVSATDADGTIPSLVTSTLPSGAAFIDNGDGTGSFSWTPDFTQSGAYNVTFTASDGALVDSEVVSITVNEAGNQTPILTAIGSQATTEGIQLQFSVSATDPDGIFPALLATPLPSGASFIDNGDGTADFDWTPTFTQAGLYNIKFVATDGVKRDSEFVSITVIEAGNQSPVLAAIGTQSTTEGINLNFNISATDPDGSIPGFTANPLPSGASFVNNGNGTATFNWTPDFTQAGAYNVTFVASDGVLADSEVVTINVSDVGNQAPVLASIGAQSVTEGVLLAFNISATDPDATIPTLITSTLPSGAVFIDNGDGTGSFNWTPTFTQSGIYPVTFYATDGFLTDSEVVNITVNDAGNQSPILATIGQKVVVEGINLNFNVSATDPDATIPVLTATDIPVGATFLDNGDGTATFNWTPAYTQSGIYFVFFYASDGLAIDSEVVRITVIDAGNQIPILAAIGPKNTNEGVNLNFGVSATDPDGTIPSLFTSVPLPAGASFVNNGDGTGTFDWTPGFDQSGVYNITFFASDGAARDSEIVSITVVDGGNQPPVLAAIGPKNGTEGVNLLFAVSATDIDGTFPQLATSTLPILASFVDNGDGTGSFDWTPAFVQSGIYNITFYASDGVFVDSEIVTITINDAGNQAPVLFPIGALATNEGINLLINITAADPDSTIPTLSTSTLPSGATFVDSANGIGTFSWTPDFTQSGIYTIRFRATDGLGLADSEVVTITVGESGNQPPILDSIGAQSVDENVPLNLVITGTDPDGLVPVLSTSALPAGATFMKNGNGTADFDWTPTFTQSGLYNITFYVSDGVFVDSEVVPITVNEVGNQTPVLIPTADTSILEGTLLSFSISSTDEESIPVLTTSALPAGATFTDSTNGNGSFEWTPDFTQSGVYVVTFYATDDSAAVDSDAVVITVTEAGNQDPIITPIGAQGVVEGNLLSILVTAVDPDGAIPVLTTSTLPFGANFVDSGNGSGLFEWTPNFTQAGIYDVTFYAADDSSAIDSEVVTITVNDVGNVAPVLAPIPDTNVTETFQLTFNVFATDPDSTIPALATSILPSGATFVDSGNGVGTFDWTPGYSQDGLHQITFYASDGTAIDSQVVNITVFDVGNQPPVLDSIGPKSGDEGVLLSFTVTASDAESIPVLTTSALPAGAVFVDSSNGVGYFDWTPGYTQAGAYNISFYAADDSAAVDSELITITIAESGDQPPVFDSVFDHTVIEEDTLIVVVSASDPEGTPVTLSINTPLQHYTFVDSGNGVGVLTYTPNLFDAGQDTVRFLATDSGATQRTTTAISLITTTELNQPPIFVPAGPFAVEVDDTLMFTIVAKDTTDQNPFSILSLSAISLPTNATFTDLGNDSGLFVFAPVAGQEGADTVNFLATDEGTPALSVSMDVEIVVVGVNVPPVLDPIGPQTVVEGQQLVLNISGYDPDSTMTPYFSVSAQNLAGNYTFVDNGDGTAVFTFNPNFVQAGLKHVEFKIHDGIDVDKEVVIIQVYDAGNQAPVFDSIPAWSIVEGDSNTFIFTAQDPDGGNITLNVDVTTPLPSNFFFTDSGNGLGALRVQPDYAQSGTYDIDFVASDDSGSVTTSTFTVDVIEAGPQPPVLDTIIDQSVAELSALSFRVSATDLDQVPPVLSTAPLPGTATFVDSTNGAGAFFWTPSIYDSGSYQIMFYATDASVPSMVDSQQVTVTVIDVNQTPILALGPPSNAIFENDTLVLTFFTFDPDSSIPTLEVALSGQDTLATNMSFVDNGDGTGTFTFMPDYTQGNSNPTLYSYFVRAIDQFDTTIFATSGTRTVQVFNRNQAPILNFPNGTGPFNLVEGETLSFNVFCQDLDGIITSFNAAGLPAGATFTGNLSFRAFSWTTTFTQSGSYNIDFFAVDNQNDTTFQQIQINVAEFGNHAPTFTTVLPDTIDYFVGVLVQRQIAASDLDLDSIVLIMDQGPGVFIDSGNGLGINSYEPDPTELGFRIPVTFIATDVPSGVSDTLSTYYRINSFLRGDVDGNYTYTMNDIVYLIRYLYRGGPAPVPLSSGDADMNGLVNVADATYMINFLYRYGPRPPQ